MNKVAQHSMRITCLYVASSDSCIIDSANSRIYLIFDQLKFVRFAGRVILYYNHYLVHIHHSRVHQSAGFCLKYFRRLYPDSLGGKSYSSPVPNHSIYAVRAATPPPPDSAVHVKR